jgi:hypothetical protein
MRYLVLVSLGLKALHFCVEDAETIHITFFRMAAHQLLPNADAQNGLREGWDDFVETSLLQVVHGCACFALTREDDAVSSAQFFLRICQQRFHPQPLQSMNDREDVSRIVFHYGNLHLTFAI